MVNVKFLNPFIDAASEVLSVEAHTSTTKGSLTLQKSAMTTDDITVLLSLIGQIQGVVLYGMSVKTALALVTRMVDQEFPEFDNLAQSGIAELGNVITGRATIKLSEAGYTTNISPPTLIQGQGLQISTLDFSRIVLPLVTEVGDIMVHLALRETPPGGPQDKIFVPLTVAPAK